MLTDADWNEATDILRGQSREDVNQIVGSGVPRVGGLTILDNHKFNPGYVYVDGILGRIQGDFSSLIDLENQANLSNDVPTLSGKSAMIYADIWDRTVTALEDDEFLDPALRGADTCTREETMLQLKWFYNPTLKGDYVSDGSGDEPNLSDYVFTVPNKGNAKINLSLRAHNTLESTCDPCAKVVELDSRVGNYLFRVEVHDVKLNANDEITKIYLKWSSENGSEHHQEDRIPEDFKSSEYIYEFYDAESEKNLGAYKMGGYEPQRGVLTSTYAKPGGGLPNTYVRRWDGYCVLKKSGSGWKMTQGIDKGVVLKDKVSAEAQGYYDLGTSLEMNLSTMDFELEITNKDFVAGDYWLATVRENVTKGNEVELESELPHGILHHYLPLAIVESNGSKKKYSDGDRRQLNFPQLTDMQANKIAYSPNLNCKNGLFDKEHNNVKKALDELCHLSAEHIAYDLPNCASPTTTINDLMGTDWPDDGSDGDRNVKDILDGILCKVKAGHIPYDPTVQLDEWKIIKDTADLGSPPMPDNVQDALDNLLENFDSSLVVKTEPNCAPSDLTDTVKNLLLSTFDWSDADVDQVLNAFLCDLSAKHIPLDKSDLMCNALQASDVVTVHDALEKLCENTGGGCEVTVGDGGDYPTLQEALETLENSAVICICLLAGTHTLSGGEVLVKATESIAIKSCSVGSSLIVISNGASLTFEAPDIHLSHLNMVMKNKTESICLKGEIVTVEKCVVDRNPGSSSAAPLMIVKSYSSRQTMLRFQDNFLDTQYTVNNQGTVGIGVFGDLVKKITESLPSVKEEVVMKKWDDFLYVDPKSDPAGFNKAKGELVLELSALDSQDVTKMQEGSKAYIENLSSEAKSVARIFSFDFTESKNLGYAGAAYNPGEVSRNILNSGALRSEKTSDRAMMTGLIASVVSGNDNAIAESLDVFASLNNESAYTTALTLEDNRIEGYITDNLINGNLVVLEDHPNEMSDNVFYFILGWMTEEIFSNCRGSLHVTGNDIWSFQTKIPTDFKTEGLKEKHFSTSFATYKHLFFYQNILHEAGFISAEKLNVEGNHCVFGRNDILAKQVTFNGNHLEDNVLIHSKVMGASGNLADLDDEDEPMGRIVKMRVHRSNNLEDSNMTGMISQFDFSLL